MSKAGESAYAPFGTFFCLQAGGARRSLGVLRLQRRETVESYLRSSIAVATPNMLAHHALQCYTCAEIGRAHV